jgi:dihydrofolate reductase
MRRILVSEFVTLDGVIEAPGYEEHRDGRNAWALSLTSEDMLAHAAQQLLEIDALLLGRVTYQHWAAFWPLATDVFLGEQINALPKYVVSNTLTDLSWNNSTLISGDVPAQIAKLKQSPGGDILVSGSADLFDLLLKHDLIDELRYMLYPVVLGSGKHLFRDHLDTAHFRLVGTRAFDSGVVVGSADQVAAGRGECRPHPRLGPVHRHRRFDRPRSRTGRSPLAATARSPRSHLARGGRPLPRAAHQEHGRRHPGDLRHSDTGNPVRRRDRRRTRRLGDQDTGGHPHGRDPAPWSRRGRDRRAHRVSGAGRGQRGSGSGHPHGA